MAEIRLIQKAEDASVSLVLNTARWHRIQAKHARKVGSKRDMQRHERIAEEMHERVKMMRGEA